MAQKKPSSIDPMRNALRACRSLIVSAALFSIGVNLLYLAPSLFMMQVYDRVLLTRDVVTLIFVGVALVFALATLAFLDMLRARLLMRASLRLDRIVSPALLLASLRAPRRGPGEGARASALREFDTFRQTFSGAAANAIMDAPWAPIYFIICFILHPLIGLTAALGGVVLLTLAFFNARATRQTIAQSAEIAPRLYAAQEADTSSAEAARALGMRGVLVARQIGLRGELADLQTKATVVSFAYGGATKFLRLCLQSTALGLGAWLAIKGEISPGALIAASILTSRALAPLEQIIGSWRQLGQARQSYNAVTQALKNAEIQEHTALPAPKGVLRAERLILKAPDGDRFLISDVSLSVNAGDILGVVGASGAGKTSLARVISGAIAPDSGAVRIDGANFEDWEPDALGVYVGYLPQDLQLIAGTVAQNINRFAMREVDADSVDAATIEAGRASGAHDMIQRLPNGYDTVLGPNGKGLSLGQAQRVALARALYKWPPLLVLDEPNAHLDAEGEAALIASVKAAKARGCAVIIIAHRAGALALADHLMVLRDGRLDLIGPREEVMARLNAASQGGGNLTPLRPREVQS
jgi:ATP-binding cassette subfamily C protein